MSGYKGNGGYNRGPAAGPGGRPGKGVMPPRRGGGLRPQGELPQRQSDFLVPMLPFDTERRMVQEHKARNPHRKYFSETITAVTADWVRDGKGCLAEEMQRAIDIEIDSANPLILEGPAAEEEAQPSPEGKANVRLFLACGVNTPQETSNTRPCKHVMRRVDVVGASICGEARQLTAYGGVVDYNPSDAAHDDQYLISALQEVVKGQSGIDLSGVQRWTRLCTIAYDNRPSTIYFFPHVTSLSDLRMQPQCRRVTTELQETVEVPVEPEEAKEGGEEEGEGAEEGGVTDADKPKTRKEVVSKTEVTEEQVMVPTKTPLATLHEYALGKATHSDTVELCTATDIFDEWLKYEFASGIADFLAVKQDEGKSKIDDIKQKRAEADVRKRKREEHVVMCKRRKEEKITLLRQQWDEEDVGKTDEDRHESEVQRKAALRGLDKEEAQELREMQGEATAEKPSDSKKTVGVRVQKLYDMFQFFDRSKGFTPTSSVLARDWLAQILLCLDRDLTFGECLQMVTLNGLHPKTSALNYGLLTIEERVREEKKDDEDEAMAQDEQYAPECTTEPAPAAAAEPEAEGNGAEAAGDEAADAGEAVPPDQDMAEAEE